MGAGASGTEHGAMHIDDRLQTVLAQRVLGPRAAATQYRQLLALLGEGAMLRDEEALAQGWLRMRTLAETLDAREREAAVREAGAPIRNPWLVDRLVRDEPRVAAAVVERARLDAGVWAVLIPRLPAQARALLRLRDDLAPAVRDALERLGVQDRALPSPPGPAVNDEEPNGQARDTAALVERIESFRRRRERNAPMPQPISATDNAEPIARFTAMADATGRIAGAERGIAPMVVGYRITDAANDTALARSIERHLPFLDQPAAFDGAPMIAGEWRMDGMPRYSPDDMRFLGYALRLRRAANDRDESATRTADRVRQTIHELRTPVGAIQGFAEIMQQQTMGPVPNDYRALAAGIAGDAARVLALLDQLDRLAQFEGGRARLTEGSSDLATILPRIAAQVEQQASGRDVRFVTDEPHGDGAVALDAGEVELLVWRIMAALARSAAPGEHIAWRLSEGGGAVRTSFALPTMLAASDDPFRAFAGQGRRANAGTAGGTTLGTGFALRLARAEARSAGGGLAIADGSLVLTLPGLTAHAREPSRNGGAAAP